VGDIDLDSMDPQVVENDRQKLLAVERLMLETICFNFAARMPFSYVIKNGKRMQGEASLLCVVSVRVVLINHSLQKVHQICLEGCD